MKRATSALLATPCGLGCAFLLGCVQDRVYPGFYGEPQQSEHGVTAAPSGAGVAGGAGASGASESSNGGDSSAPNASAGTGTTSVAGESGAASAGTSSVPDLPNAGSAGAAGEPSEPSDDPCDLSGRWLVTVHMVTDAIGQLQTAHSYLYFEIEGEGSGFAITKGLHCGDDALAEGLFAVEVSFRGAWDAVATKIDYAGREVSSTQTSAGCHVAFARAYAVRGATYPHYADPAVPLPTLQQPANGSTPGWEDWDGDGNPGITGVLSGTISGKIFLSPRTWNEIEGTVPTLGQRFELPVRWDQETNLLAYDGSPLLASEAVRAADPSLHFAELARLDSSQAIGDDLAICEAVTELAPTLTPRAAGL